jgi:hypothetical protein
VDYNVASTNLDGPDYVGPLASNRDTMVAQGMVWIACGASNLAASVVLDTTSLADGPHTLQVVACDGSAVQVQGHHEIAFTVDNHDLACTLIAPDPAYAYLEGQTVIMEAAAGGGVGTVTSLVFRVEGVPAAEFPDPSGTFAFQTAAYGAGRIALQAEARTDAGEYTRSEQVELLILSTADADGDLLPDGWEILHFGSITNTAGFADTDRDGLDDRKEFTADTDPHDPTSRFAVTAVHPGPAPNQLVITFVSSPTRTYQVETTAGTLEEPWDILPLAGFPGHPGSTRVTNSVPDAGSTAWRIRAFAP